MRSDSGKDETYDGARAADEAAPFEIAPRKVALAAVDWFATPREKGTRARTYYDHGFDPFLADIASAADAEGCDTVVYALWSHDLRRMKMKMKARRSPSSGWCSRSHGIPIIASSDKNG